MYTSQSRTPNHLYQIRLCANEERCLLQSVWRAANFQEDTYSHYKTADTYVWTQPFSNPRSFPENSNNRSGKSISVESILRSGTAYPSLFLSIHPGKSWWKYALVQIMSSRQRRAEGKLKSADCARVSHVRIVAGVNWRNWLTYHDDCLVLNQSEVSGTVSPRARHICYGGRKAWVAGPLYLSTM